jgi:hypothetical protein
MIEPEIEPEWECLNCHAENDGDSEVCYRCEEVRP